MAGISTKGLYGLSAMYELMRSGRTDPVQIRQIAESGDIPQNYLEQILVTLKKNELVKSIRGARGGYLLAKEPEDISIFDILHALDGDLCFNTAAMGEGALALFWKERQEKIHALFNIPLSELKRFEQEYAQRMMYII